LNNTDTASSGRLTLGTKIAFGSGAMAEAVYMGLFNTFITIFYNQVIGLSNTLIGVAIMLALVGDALTDPVVGIISDRWRGKYGRRHPFMFVAPVPLALMVYCIFNPPEGLVESSHQLGLFVWLALTTILSRAFLTLYHIPHLALGGELSKDQFQRSQLFSANTMIGAASGALVAISTWGYFFAGERVRATDGQLVPGHLDPAAYGPMVICACAAIIIAIWGCALLTLKHVERLTEAPDTSERFTLVMLFREILGTFRNRNYLILMVGYFFFMITSGIYDTLNVFINTYFWELAPEEIKYFGFIALPMIILGALASPVLQKKFDRKPVIVTALIFMTIFAQLVIDLRLLGLLPANHDEDLLPILIANAGAFAFTIGVGGVAIMGMIGDLIDENELTTGLRQDGLFFSARAFFAKASYSVGHLFAGLALDLYVRLPFEAVPGQLEEAILTRMGIVAGPAMAFSAVIAVFVYSRYDLTAARHREIVVALNKRNDDLPSDETRPKMATRPSDNDTAVDA